MSTLSRLPLGLAFLALTSACGGAGGASPSVFEPGWQSDAGESIARVEAKVRSAPRPADVAVVVGITADGVAGAQLPAGSVWRHAGPVDMVPSVAAD